MADSIKVICRFRPQNKVEKAHNAFIIIQISDDHTLCVLTHPDKSKQPKPISFNFDCIFDWTSSQSEVYNHAASHLVDQIFDGFNATIFAYGQTGAGKTYSMEGKLGSPHRGIVPRTVEHIFENISESEENMEYLLQVSYVEIYLEALRDLLRPGNVNMKIRDSKTGVFIENVTEMYVRDAVEVMQLMEMGSKARTTGATQMNATSSRSHGVFMLKLTQTNTTSGTKKVSKLMMIDLAGSEKVAKTGATGMLLKEAQKINQSLSALGNVMGQLSGGKSHVSYRDSVLTRLLSDSLGGNCKTTLMIAVSPSSYNADETITTARFGVRAKKIKNKAKINAEKTVAEYKIEVKGLMDRIMKLMALVTALQHDLEKAKQGEMTVDDKGASDEVIAMVDMEYLMDDGKSKKKRKKKKKGFFRKGFEPPKLDQKKGKKSKAKSNTTNPSPETDENKYEEKSDHDSETKTAHSSHSSDEAGNDEVLMAKLAEAEKRAGTAEQHIQYLEAELIKAQAAAANGMGLADIEPAPSPRKRASILPAPHRPRASLPHTTTVLRGSTSGSNSQLSLPPAIPEELPRFQNRQSSNKLRKDMNFTMSHGALEEEENIVEENVVYETIVQMPDHLADLDPALLEQARRGLQQENYDLRKQMEQLVHELDQYHTRMQKKSEQLKQAKNNTEDAEMECDRLLLQMQVLQERIESFEDDRQRERKQIENFKNENHIYKVECEQLKQKMTYAKKEMQETIVKISKREAQRADDFMQQAIKQFKRLQLKNAQKQQAQMQQMQSLTMAKNGGSGSAYAVMSITEQQNELNRQRQVMERQMRQLKQATFEQLERIQLEQMRIKSALQSKIEECVSLNMTIADKNDEVKNMILKLRQKDRVLNRQGTELKAFGDLKLKSDQIHQKAYKKSQDTIFALKKQLNKLHRMNTNNTAMAANNGASALLNHQRTVIPTPIRGGGKGKKKKTLNANMPAPIRGGSYNNMPAPIRGGGTPVRAQSYNPSNVHTPQQQSVTNFFNQNMRKGSNTHMNGFGSASPSPMFGSHSRQESKRHNTKKSYW